MAVGFLQNLCDPLVCARGFSSLMQGDVFLFFPGLETIYVSVQVVLVFSSSVHVYMCVWRCLWSALSLDARRAGCTHVCFF